MKKSLEERFWSRADKKSSDECWEWLGSKLRGGYGNLNQEGHTLQAHRYSYVLHIGDIPKGMLVCHSCDNPGCVNPEHLFLGTHLTNAMDKVSKDRQIKGEGIYNHKIVEADAIRIRELYSQGNLSMRKIAKMFGLCYSETNAVINKRTWRYV